MIQLVLETCRWRVNIESGHSSLSLLALPGRFAICRLQSDAPVPAWAATGPLQCITRTGEELSIVCAETGVPPDVRAHRGWRALKVQGPLALTMTGVLSSLTAVLAASPISVFAVSTFDTDYLLVPAADFIAACDALSAAGYPVARSTP